MTDPLDVDPGLVLKDALLAQGVSQRELSRRSGVNQAYISRMVRGGENPKPATLRRLFGALGLDAAVALRAARAARASEHQQHG